jgi:hypothetical protein
MSEQLPTVMNNPTPTPNGYFADGSFGGTHCFYCKQPWGTSRWCAVCSAWAVRRALAERGRLTTNEG